MDPNRAGHHVKWKKTPKEIFAALVFTKTLRVSPKDAYIIFGNTIESLYHKVKPEGQKIMFLKPEKAPGSSWLCL